MENTLGTGNLSGQKSGLHNVSVNCYFQGKRGFCITYPHIYLDNLYDKYPCRVNSHEISVISHHDGLKVYLCLCIRSYVSMKPDMNNIFLISFLPCWDKKLIICAETGVSVNRSAFSEFVKFLL